MTTNREYLATLSNEELAELLGKQDCQVCIYKDIDCYRPSDKEYDCVEGILQWLNAEHIDE